MSICNLIVYELKYLKYYDNIDVVIHALPRGAPGFPGLTEKGDLAMKKSWMKRAISVMAALTLALTTAGLAEMSFAVDPYNELIVAEAVDDVVVSEE